MLTKKITQKDRKLKQSGLIYMAEIYCFKMIESR